MLVPLRLGPLEAAGFTVLRSGVRWMCEEGHVCHAGEAIGFCNIGLARPPALGPRPFADEAHDFQLVFLTRVAGRLRKAAGSSLGGFLDQQQFHQAWSADFVLGHIDTGADEAPPDLPDQTVGLHMSAGRRMTTLAENRSGLLTGWHERARAWRIDAEGEIGTLLSLGACDQLGAIRGDRTAFFELFEAIRGPAQVVLQGGEPLVPCARVLIEQIHRTPDQSAAIAEDMARSFAGGSVVPTPVDWMFMGCMLQALQRSPLTESYDMLGRTGLRRAERANAVVLSLHCEPPMLLRHKRLGYAINCHDFRLSQAGPAVRTWLEANFEGLRRTPEDSRRDFHTLIDAVAERTAGGAPPAVLILNEMSTSGDEDIQSYTAFDRPLRLTLSSVWAKEMNLMLYDLKRDRDISIVDIDAIAADLGANTHLPDGIHESGAMQTEVRGEILRILRERGVPGFGPATA